MKNLLPRWTMLRTSSVALMLLSVSGCASLIGTTETKQLYEPPVKPSICLIDRERLRYSRQDTEQTKLNLDEVLVQWDAACT